MVWREVPPYEAESMMTGTTYKIFEGRSPAYASLLSASASSPIINHFRMWDSSGPWERDDFSQRGIWRPANRFGSAVALAWFRHFDDVHEGP